MNISRTLRFALLTTVVAAFPATAQDITANSRFFTVSDYYYPDQNGDYRPYRVFGFAEQLAPPTRSKMMILPTLSVRPADVKFFNKSGSELQNSQANADNIGSISVRVRYASAVPSPQQVPAIAAALNGISITNYMPPSLQDNFGNPAMTPQAGASMQLAMAIRAANAAYTGALMQQNQLMQQYAAYESQPIPMNELKVALMIDGQEIASMITPGGSLSSMPPVTLVDPTVVQLNKLKEGNFYVAVSYRFRDSAASSINATIDRHVVMQHFLKETQDAITKRKSSGFQVFHIGSRRSKISTSISQRISSSSTLSIIQNTQIVMRDANDSMVERFEEAFFPSLSKEDTIRGHLDAAAAASAAGNPELARVHTEYAASLRDNDETKEVDAVGAAAALNAGDYATFIAKGVRMSSSNNTRANSFKRVINDRQQMDQVVNWSDTQIVGVQREVAVTVQPEQSPRQTVLFGICAALPGPMPVSTPWGPRQVAGIIPTCVTNPGAFAAANLLPGTLVTYIGGRQIATLDDLRLATQENTAGEPVSVTIWDFAQNRERSITVRPTRGAPVREEDRNE